MSNNNKKEFIEKLGKINNVLDIMRTNLNIIIYNSISNNLISDFPTFDNEKILKLINEVDTLISGVNVDYFTKNEEAKKENIKQNGEKD